MLRMRLGPQYLAPTTERFVFAEREVPFMFLNNSLPRSFCGSQSPRYDHKIIKFQSVALMIAPCN
jgi:hypothetical protein